MYSQPQEGANVDDQNQTESNEESTDKKDSKDDEGEALINNSLALSETTKKAP